MDGEATSPRWLLESLLVPPQSSTIQAHPEQGDRIARVLYIEMSINRKYEREKKMK